MRQKKYFISLIIIGLTTTLFAQNHPTARDIAAMNRVSNVQFSTDGAWLTYLLETNTFDSTSSQSDGGYLGGWNADHHATASNGAQRYSLHIALRSLDTELPGR